MGNLQWYHKSSSRHDSEDITLGLWLVHSHNAWGHPNIRVILGLWHRMHTFWFYRARRKECLTKPGKPSSAA